MLVGDDVDCVMVAATLVFWYTGLVELADSVKLSVKSCPKVYEGVVSESLEVSSAELDLSVWARFVVAGMMKVPFVYETRKVLVAVTMTVRSVLVSVEFDVSVLDKDPGVSCGVGEDDESFALTETSTAGIVRVPRLERVIVASLVAAAISVMEVPSLTATSTTLAVKVTSGTRGRMTLPAFLFLYTGL